MYRYMDLIKKILEYTVCHGDGRELALPEIHGHSPEEVRYHVKLCEEAGYLDISVSESTAQVLFIVRITWQGHEFLESKR